MAGFALTLESCLTQQNCHNLKSSTQGVHLIPWRPHSRQWGCFAVIQLCPTLCDPHRLQHTRLPCPSPHPGACSNSCPLSRWWFPTILSSIGPFSFLQSFPASGSSLISQLFASGGQNIRASVLASVLPTNIQDWFPLGLTDLIFLQWYLTLNSNSVSISAYTDLVNRLGRNRKWNL